MYEEETKMKVAIASDHGGINLRQEIISLMEKN